MPTLRPGNVVVLDNSPAHKRHSWAGFLVLQVRERPRLKVGSSERGKVPLDTYGMMFFSNRFKLLLCEFLPEDAVEMIECDARDLKWNDVGPYWWMDFMRVLDAVDETRSVLTEGPPVSHPSRG